MGTRYRKSIKVAPGVKVNVGKKSVGISVGNEFSGILFIQFFCTDFSPFRFTKRLNN